MYTPKQVAIPKKFAKTVNYAEFAADHNLANTVSTYWRHSSVSKLKAGFTYTVLPDARIDVIFDVSPKADFKNALVTQLLLNSCFAIVEFCGNRKAN
jgi:hypothetical protein